MDQDLLAALAARARDPESATDLGHGISNSKGQPVLYVANPPATPSDLLPLEEQSGASVPLDLRDCLLLVGNGGFGPGYGLLSSVQMRRELALLTKCHASWPSPIVPIVEWGCGIFTCLDFSLSRGASLYRYDPDVEPEDLREWLGSEPVAPGLSPEARDLSGWLIRWLDGEDLFEFTPPT